MTDAELHAAIYEIECAVNQIYRTVPTYARAAMPALTKNAEHVIDRLELLRARLVSEGVERGETEKP